MTKTTTSIKRGFFARNWKRLLIFFSVFGPATITGMADNDAGGVATFSIAGAQLGYPILFPLVIIAVLLAVTQEMSLRLTVITRKGLGDLIREKYGVKAAVFMFAALLVANLGTLITELSAVRTTAVMLHIPPAPSVIVIVVISFFMIVRGNFKITQSLMLIAGLFFLVYIFSAIKARPDWGLALSNLAYPHGVEWTPKYTRDFLLIGMGVLGTSITPWGQFFVSSFAFDKKIEKGKVNYSQLEAYWGAFLAAFFSFFMVVATAAALFGSGKPLLDGAQAAEAIRPIAGNLAGTLFAVGILNAGFMGLVVVSLSTAYAFAEFFGVSGSLDDSFKKSKTFYILFGLQMVIAATVALLGNISLFKIAVLTQTINAITLPLVFYYLLKLTSDRLLMGQFINNNFQKYFSITCTVIIVIASAFTVAIAFF